MKPSLQKSWTFLLLSTPAWAGSFSLSDYQLTARYDLPALEASEASAVTYNWDTGTLFVLGDEGEYVAEIGRDGAFLSSMSLSGFEDTEGLTYSGGGNFALAEERIQDAFQFAYSAGTNVDRSSLLSASLGITVGNIGIEGISYDPRDGSYVAVKEKTPQQVLAGTIDFAGGTASVSDLFVPNLGLSDLSDVQALSVVPSLDGTPDADNLLIYSQESALLLEVDRRGNVLSQFDFSTLASNAEGVTIDDQGVIYVVGETPEMFVLSPIPEPAVMGLLAAGLGLIAIRRHQRK